MMKLNEVKKYGSKLLLAGGTLASVPAFAAADYTAIVSASDFAAAGTAIVAIFATVAIAFIAWKGGKMVLSALR